MNHQPSEVQPFSFRGASFYVKRDDLLDPLLSGNKYRKLYSLIQTPKPTYHTIISYGGTQSNAMLSIAALCAQKQWRFDYYSKPVAQHLKDNPSANFKLALDFGMTLHEVPHALFAATVQQLNENNHAQTLCIPQGGADPMAAQGIQQLAQEIEQWQSEHACPKLNIVTPSGTGTTAYYLAKFLPQHRIFTTASVGDNHYLCQQIQQLGNMPSNLVLLEPSKKYHFAKPYPEFLALHQQLHAAGIDFDLIYAPKMWQTLLEQRQHIQGSIMYVHSGGLLGNPSMLQRYQRTR